MARELKQAAYAERANEVTGLLNDPAVNQYEHSVVWPIMENLFPENPATVLDFGCGSGYFTGLLADRFPVAKITGTDSSPAMLDEAKQSDARIAWQVWDGIERPPEDWERKFDLVVCKMVLHYISDLRRVVNNLVAVTSETGKVVVSVPHPGETMYFNDRKKLGDEYDISRQYHGTGTYQREIGSTGVKATMFHRRITDWTRPFERHGLGLRDFEEPCKDGQPKRLILGFSRLPNWLVSEEVL